MGRIRRLRPPFVETASASVPHGIAWSPALPVSSVCEVILERLDGDLKMLALLSGGGLEPRAHALEAPLGTWTERTRLSSLVSPLDRGRRRWWRHRPRQRLSFEQRTPLGDHSRLLDRPCGRGLARRPALGARRRSTRSLCWYPRHRLRWRRRAPARPFRDEPGPAPARTHPKQRRADAGHDEPSRDPLPACHGGTTSLDWARMLTVLPKVWSVPRTRTDIPRSPAGLSPPGIGPST
jgi:hypothetical protein